MIVRWIVAGVLAPIAILLHEGGHALVDTLRECSDVAIHWTYTTSSCSGGSVDGHIAELAAGPLTSWLLVLVGWLVARTRPRPEAFILAVCSAGRALISIEALGTSASGTDEAKLTRLTGIPNAAFVVPQVILAIVTFVWAWRWARRLGVQRDAAVGMLVAGASGALYMFVVGPIILP